MLTLIKTHRRGSLATSAVAFVLLACLASGCARPAQEQAAEKPPASREADAQPPQLSADDGAEPPAVSENAGIAIAAGGDAEASDSLPGAAEAEGSDEAPAGLDDDEIDVGGIDAQVESERDFELPDRFEGSEIIARVGPEVIMARDVLYDANPYLQRALKKASRPLSADEIERARKLFMSIFLKNVIQVKLAVVDWRRSLPKRHLEAAEMAFNIKFARECVPKLLAAEECGSLAELDVRFHEAGTSLESLRRQIWERSLAQFWVNERAKDDREISQQEVQDYYQAHHADYETLGRARWKHLMARFDKPDTNKDEARAAIAGAHEKVKAGSVFDEVAKANPEKVSLDDESSWIEKGSLVSEVLDQALFTLPIDQLSEILEDERGVHVILVVEREAGSVTALADVELAIRQKIKDERNLDRRNEYQAKLEKTIPVWNAFKEAGFGTEFNESAKALASPVDPAESPAAGKTPASYPNTGFAAWTFSELFQGEEQPAQRTAP